VRIVTIAGLSTIASYIILQAWQLGDAFVAYSTIMLLQALAILTVGWFFYRNPATGQVKNDLVSVIIPVYNEKSNIGVVVDAVYRSTYDNVEVVVVNDGSTDGTKEILENLEKKYPNMKVIHKKNEGKRKAVATAFFVSRGRYVVLIDSDSVVDKHAIEEFVKAFNSDLKIGAAVGHVKVWNAKNILTKCQDVWYDFAFNIHKACESTFGTVTCCSGCLSAYRREAIARYIPYWAEAKIQNSSDRTLTSYTIATPMVKSQLAPISQRLMESMAQYDDAEDRGLTAQSIVVWKSVYVVSAIAYTQVPEKFRGFLKQQTRWKKGYIRTNFFVSTFFWRKNPLMSLIYYTEFMANFTAPFITFIVFFYVPFILHNFWLPAAYLAGLLLRGLAQGLDYKFRDARTKNWKYKPMMSLITSFILDPLLIFPALLNFRKNQWLTR
jgi:hyaluronan synthase